MITRQPIDTHRIKAAHSEAWYAEILAAIDGVNIRFRVMRDTAASLHRHPEGPEGFFVLSGSVAIDTEHGSTLLGPGQFFEVGTNVQHRARVQGEATLLVFDKLAV